MSQELAENFQIVNRSSLGPFAAPSKDIVTIASAFKWTYGPALTATLTCHAGILPSGVALERSAA